MATAGLPEARKQRSARRPWAARRPQKREKAQVNGGLTWAFWEPPSGFEPETYASRDRERSCCVVPGRAVCCRSSWSEHMRQVGQCCLVLRRPKASGHRLTTGGVRRPTHQGCWSPTDPPASGRRLPGKRFSEASRRGALRLLAERTGPDRYALGGSGTVRCPVVLGCQRPAALPCVSAKFELTFPRRCLPGREPRPVWCPLGPAPG
jgi:hypothetical protein